MKITTNRKKRNWLLLPVLLIILGGCDKSHSDIEPTPEPPVYDGPLEQVEVTVDRPGNGAGLRYVDLMEGEAYAHEDVFMTREHNIDLMVYNGGSTNINFITPDDGASLGGFGQGRDVRDFWQVKNAGTFVKLPTNPSNEELFNNLTSSVQLRETIAEGFRTITDMPGYTSRDHGPGRVIEVTEGDFLLFRSSSRNVQAMIKVTAHEPGNAGSLTFIAKLDRMNEKEIEPAEPFGPPGDPIELNVTFGGASGGAYIDLATLDVYTEAEAELNAEVVDLVLLEGNNSNTNFITVDNDAGLGGFNASLRNRLQAWETPRNEGEFQFSNSAVAREVFDQLGSTYEDIRRAYLGIEEDPVKRQTNSVTGNVLFFYSATRDMYVAIKIVNRIKHSASSGELDLLVKVGARGSGQ